MAQDFHVVIVGGGFSGTSLAIHLLRRGGDGLRVTIVERRERLGRGIAYETGVESHLLNTRSACMSVFSDAPAHFQCWLENVVPDASPYASRKSYGDYLEGTLAEELARRPSSPVAFCPRTSTCVTRVDRLGSHFEVVLDDGETLTCDAVVLATGHPPPADPLAKWLDPDAPRYIRDAWSSCGIDQIRAVDRVLILGTGLTMVDMVLALRQGGHRGELHASSRHGLLPRVHASDAEVIPADLQEYLLAMTTLRSVRKLLRTMRDAIELAATAGHSWQAVMDAMRAITPQLWSSLDGQERRRFLRHLRPYWDVHRHRLSPLVASRVAELRRSGRLSITRGRITRATEIASGRLLVDRETGGASRRQDVFDWVINCTGPAFSMQSRMPFYDGMIREGLLTVDPLELGYVTDADYRSIGEGAPVEGLYIVGPACRPLHWEHTAVPELRKQAESLAQRLVAGRHPQKSAFRLARVPRNGPVRQGRSATVAVRPSATSCR